MLWQRVSGVGKKEAFECGTKVCYISFDDCMLLKWTPYKEYVFLGSSGWSGCLLRSKPEENAQSVSVAHGNSCTKCPQQG